MDCERSLVSHPCERIHCTVNDMAVKPCCYRAADAVEYDLMCDEYVEPRPSRSGCKAQFHRFGKASHLCRRSGLTFIHLCGLGRWRHDGYHKEFPHRCYSPVKAAKVSKRIRRFRSSRPFTSQGCRTRRTGYAGDYKASPAAGHCPRLVVGVW